MKPTFNSGSFDSTWLETQKRFYTDGRETENEWLILFQDAYLYGEDLDVIRNAGFTIEDIFEDDGILHVGVKEEKN